MYVAQVRNVYIVRHHWLKGLGANDWESRVLPPIAGPKHDLTSRRDTDS
jgi:hypothetical protein